MVERTHEFISAGSEIDPSAPIAQPYFPFRQNYNYARLGKLNVRPDTVITSLPVAGEGLDEPHPGIDEIEGAFYDAAYDPQEQLIRKCGEYSSANYRFWFFLFGALAFSVLMFMAVFIGFRDREFLILDEPIGAPKPEIVIVGFVIFAFLTAYVAYHNWKERNGPTFRNGCVFLLIATWIFALWWAVLFYAQHSERDSSVSLFLSIFALIIWIHIVLTRGKYDQMRVYLLILALAWLAYLLYYNIGIIKNLPCPDPTTFLSKDVNFGTKSARENRFERFRRNTII